jgi:hypothetical protein
MSTEAFYNLDVAEQRSITAALREDLPDFPTLVTNRAKKKKEEEHRFSLGEGFYYTRDSEYGNSFNVIKYHLKHEKISGDFHFQTIQYPACCGLSILYNFYGFNGKLTDAQTQDLLKRFFDFTGPGYWSPNIQFVAVREALEYEELETEDSDDDIDNDDWYEEDNRKAIAWNTEYNVRDFIRNMIHVFKPTLISSFVNTNSDNICDVYQFVTPKDEE